MHPPWLLLVLLLLGQKAPGRPQEENYIYIQLASFLPVQFSNNPPLALPFFFFFFFFFSLALSPFVPSFLAALLQALGKQKSAQERNRRGDDWKHELSFFSAF
jgi:hypothetical protein